MKNKLLWAVIIIIVILLVLGFLYSQGLIHVKWEWLAIILAGLAAPFKLISNFLSGKSVKTQKILDSHVSRIQEEQKHRVAYDQTIKQKEERIIELEAEVASLEEKIDNIELQQQQVKKQVNQMTDIDDLQNAFIDAYGDES